LQRLNLRASAVEFQSTKEKKLVKKPTDGAQAVIGEHPSTIDKSQYTSDALQLMIDDPDSTADQV